MNHETLKALYQLDVDEVGEEEAAKRWELYTDWPFPELPTTIYRRKPGIPWPKVMQRYPEGEVIGPCICGSWPGGKCLRCPVQCSEQPSTQWPDDAPEWADRLTRIFYSTVTFQSESQPYVFKPKPAKQKIDWSKLPAVISRHLFITRAEGEPLSDWIAWNCDESTRGNPLPDGLVVEWLDGSSTQHWFAPTEWGLVTRFRIIGIQEGWE